MVNAFRDIALSDKSPSISEETQTEDLSLHSIIRRRGQNEEAVESIPKSSYLKPISSEAFIQLSRDVPLEDPIISQIIPELDFNFDTTVSQTLSGCTDIYKEYRKLSQMGTNTFVSKNVESSFFRTPNLSINPVKSEIDEFVFSQPIDDDFNFEIPPDSIRTQSDFKFLESQPENRKDSFFDFEAPKRQTSEIDFFDFESQIPPTIPFTPIVLPKEEYFSMKSDYFRSASEIMVIDSEKQSKSSENSKIQISSSNSSHYNVSSSNINELESVGSISSADKSLDKSKEFKNLFMEKNIRKAMSYKGSKVADNKIYNSARIERIKNVKLDTTISTIAGCNSVESGRSGILKNREIGSNTSKKSNSVTFASEPKPVFYKPFNVKQKMIFDSWHKAKPYKKPRVVEILVPAPRKEVDSNSVSGSEDVQTSTEDESVEKIVERNSPISLVPEITSIFTSFVDAPLRKPVQRSIDKNVKCRTHPGIFID